MAGLRRERGFALLEAAAWLAVLLPAAILGASLCMQLYNQRTLAIIPEAVLRETQSPSLRWASDGEDGSFWINDAEMMSAAAELVASAVGEATNSLLSVKHVSARACCWVLRVDAQSGLSSGIERQRCISSGEVGLAGELDRVFGPAADIRVGAPLEPSSSSELQFSSRALIFGVAVGAVFVGPMPDVVLAQAHIAYPRREIAL